jgi:hypothetical protein
VRMVRMALHTWSRNSVSTINSVQVAVCTRQLLNRSKEHPTGTTSIDQSTARRTRCAIAFRRRIGASTSTFVRPGPYQKWNSSVADT